LAEPGLSYRYTCPQCAGNFSIELEKIPPVQARFGCPGCRHLMNFPSRDEARVYATLAQSAPAPAAGRSSARPAVAALDESPAGAGPAEGTRFRIEKAGFKGDVFDRRAMRNLIRTGEVTENDRVRMDDANSLLAGDVPYLKSLFALRKSSRGTPPASCRTHTARVALYRCVDSSRPLCEDCAPSKQFGGTTVRVCTHCGGTVAGLAPA
jgi:hypothetical protein